MPETVTSKLSRKEIERQTRRRIVVEATRNLLIDNDIETVSMDRIAAEVDYTRRTLYAYFGSRDEVLLMVLTEDLEQRWAIQKKMIDSSASGLDQLTAWAEALYDYVKRHPESLQLQAYWDFHKVREDSVAREAFAAFEDINNRLAEGLRGIFRAGVDDGSIRSDLNLDMAISQFLYSFRAVINRALSKDYSFARFDAGDYIRQYITLLRRAVGNNTGNRND